MGNETVKIIAVTLKDARGEIRNICDQPLSHIAIITSKAGSIRANHYHPNQEQQVYLISGKYESYSKDLTKENAPVETITVEAGSLVTTPAMIAHAMKFLEDSMMLNIELGDRHPENFDQHTKPYVLIKK